MSASVLAMAGVIGGWLVFAASIVPILRRPARSSRRDTRSIPAMLLQGSGFALAWGGFRRLTGPVPGPSYGPWLWAAAVTLLALASGLFAVAAVRHLGRQWSIVARLAEEHQLITTGPYAVVRHPIYTAMLGLLVATGLTFSTVTATLTGAVLYLVGTVVRTRLEERLLIEAFGTRYREYQSRVPAILPFPRN